MHLCSCLVALLWLTLPCAYAASPSEAPEGAHTITAAGPALADLIPKIQNMRRVLAARPLMLHARSPKHTWTEMLRVPPTASLPEAPLAAMVEQLPLIGALQRRTAPHFNTTDSSHPNDFAICYRLSQRMGLQIVPGDATPHKSYASRTPTTIVAFGMTIRMDRLK